MIHGFIPSVKNGAMLLNLYAGAVEIGSYFIAGDDYAQVGPEQILAHIPAMLL